MKVFSMNDCDWMAGPDLKSCMEEYKTKYSGWDSFSEEEGFVRRRWNNGAESWLQAADGRKV